LRIRRRRKNGRLEVGPEREKKIKEKKNAGS
jgi:hypothetical protein